MVDSEFNTHLRLFWKLAFFGVLAGFVGILGEMNSTIDNEYSMNDNELLGENMTIMNSRNMSNFTIRMVNKAVTMFCERFNYSESTPKVLVDAVLFLDCLSEVLDIETLKSEIIGVSQQNSTNTKLDGIFGKYCEHASELKVCLHGVLLGLLPCTPALLRQYEYMLENASYSVIEWACSDNGSRIERFIDEGGRECLMEQIPEAMGCMGENSSVPTLNTNITSNTSLIERCTKFDTMIACNIDKLEACKSNITSEIATSAFNFIREMTPCFNITINVDEGWENEFDPNTFNITEDEVTTELSVMSREL